MVVAELILYQATKMLCKWLDWEVSIDFLDREYRSVSAENKVHIFTRSPSRVVVRYPHHTPLQWAE